MYENYDEDVVVQWQKRATVSATVVSLIPTQGNGIFNIIISPLSCLPPLNTQCLLRNSVENAERQCLNENGVFTYVK